MVLTNYSRINENVESHAQRHSFIILKIFTSTNSARFMSLYQTKQKNNVLIDSGRYTTVTIETEEQHSHRLGLILNAYSTAETVESRVTRLGAIQILQSLCDVVNVSNST